MVILTQSCQNKPPIVSVPFSVTVVPPVSRLHLFVDCRPLPEPTSLYRDFQWSTKSTNSLVPPNSDQHLLQVIVRVSPNLAAKAYCSSPSGQAYLHGSYSQITYSEIGSTDYFTFACGMLPKQRRTRIPRNFRHTENLTVLIGEMNRDK